MISSTSTKTTTKATRPSFRLRQRTEMLDLELTVVGGEHSGRKVRDLITVGFDDSESNDPDIMPVDPDQAERYRTAVRIGRSKLRAILESAHAINPNDHSDQ